MCTLRTCLPSCSYITTTFHPLQPRHHVWFACVKRRQCPPSPLPTVSPFQDNVPWQFVYEIFITSSSISMILDIEHYDHLKFDACRYSLVMSSSTGGIDGDLPITHHDKCVQSPSLLHFNLPFFRLTLIPPLGRHGRGRGRKGRVKTVMSVSGGDRTSGHRERKRQGCENEGTRVGRGSVEHTEALRQDFENR